MAITKIIGSIHAPSKGRKYQVLKNTIDYILNPMKTEQGKYTGAVNCLVDNALSEMKRNFRYWHKEPKNQRDRIGYHFTISWKAGCKISAETALKITEEFCKELLNDYPLIYAVHTDKDHIHSHICFSSVSCIDGKKYRYNDNDWEKILQPVTDRLCQKYGFPTLEMDREALGEEIDAAEETKQRNGRRAYKRKKFDTGNGDDTRKGYDARKEYDAGKGYGTQTEEEKKQKRRSNTKYYKEETEAYSKQDHIRVDIDDAVYRSRSWSDFITIMRSKGYQMKFGKYFSVKAPGLGMEKYRRTYRLGEEYSEKAIRDRIAVHDQPLPKLYHPEEETVQFEKDVRYKGRIRLTEESRKHYAMQYRQGLLKPGQNRSYYVIRSAIYRMRKAEQREKFLAGHQIYDIQSARTALADYEILLKKAEKEKKEFFEKRSPYMSLIRKYRECEEYQDIYTEFHNAGEGIFQEETEKYEAYLKLLKLNGLKQEEFEQFCEAAAQELKRLNKKKRELYKEKRIIEGYIKEIGIRETEQERVLQERKEEEENRGKEEEYLTGNKKR